MLAVALVLEVIGHTGEHLDGTVVHVVGSVLLFGATVKVPNDGGFEGDRPSLLFAEVEIEVQTCLRGHVIATVITDFEVVHQANAIDTFHLEDAGFTLVAEDGVGEVELGEQVSVHSVNGILAVGDVVGGSSLHADTEDRGDLLRHLETVGCTSVLEHSVVSGLGVSTTNETNGPVVKETRALDGLLCIAAEDNGTHCEKSKEFFHKI